MLMLDILSSHSLRLSHYQGDRVKGSVFRPILNRSIPLRGESGSQQGAKLKNPFR